MSRQRMPAIHKAGKSETKAHLDERAEIEAQLAGDGSLIEQIPEQLDDLGKQYYEFLVDELKVSGILSNLDIPILTQTADCLSKMHQADLIINKEGILWRGEDKFGNEILKEHPTVNTKQKYLSQFRALANQLGLSPSSRAALAETKIQNKNDEEDPVKKLLSQVNG